MDLQKNEEIKKEMAANAKSILGTKDTYLKGMDGEKVKQMADKIETDLKNWCQYFGKDNGHRSTEQWRRLVKTYGFETVCEKSEITADELHGHLKTRSFSQQLKHKARVKKLEKFNKVR